tara:strand:- start:1623 stop:2159 length:537 start_codon:yes stop_codon:yes gene_type:complete
MNYIYYGNESCDIEGNVSSIDIKYNGAIKLYPKSPNNYFLSVGKDRIIIAANVNNTLDHLFKYEGDFKINSISAFNISEKVNCSIIKSMHYSEYLHSNAEDLTLLSEELNSTYSGKIKIKETIIIDNISRRLHTSKTKSQLYLEGKKYKGWYHVLEDGSAMTGRIPNFNSKQLSKGLK